MKPPAAARGLGVVRPGDAVVEQPAARLQLAEQEREVTRELALADVLGQADGADRVEPGFWHVPVVEVAHLRQIGQPVADDGLLRPRRLLRRQGDTECLDAVLAGGVPDHAAPAAADVQQPHPGLERQLPGDQFVLVGLRLLQGGVLVRVAGTGVGHGRAEHPLVERVGHVVVVRDGRGVPALGVPLPADPAAPHPHLLGRRRHPRVEKLRPAQFAEEPEPFGRAHAHALRLGHPRERGVHVAVHVEMAGDVGPGQAERTRRLGYVGRRDRRADRDPHRRAGNSGLASVVGAELHRGVRARDPLEHLGQRHDRHPFATCRVPASCRARTSRTARTACRLRRRRP